MLKFCAQLRLISFTLSFLLFSSGAFANEDAKEDMDALKAEFNAQIEALNNRELEASVVSAHAEIVLYGIFSPFPVNGKADFKKAVQAYFGQYEAAELSPGPVTRFLAGRLDRRVQHLRATQRRRLDPRCLPGHPSTARCPAILPGFHSVLARFSSYVGTVRADISSSTWIHGTRPRPSSHTIRFLSSG